MLVGKRNERYRNESFIWSLVSILSVFPPLKYLSEKKKPWHSLLQSRDNCVLFSLTRCATKKYNEVRPPYPERVVARIWLPLMETSSDVTKNGGNLLKLTLYYNGFVFLYMFFLEGTVGEAKGCFAQFQLDHHPNKPSKVYGRIDRHSLYSRRVKGSALSRRSLFIALPFFGHSSRCQGDAANKKQRNVQAMMMENERAGSLSTWSTTICLTGCIRLFSRLGKAGLVLCSIKLVPSCKRITKRQNLNHVGTTYNCGVLRYFISIVCW